MAKSRKLQCNSGPDAHYYASSLAAWRTNNDLDKLVRDMKADGLPFNVFRVELPADASYAIQMFQPVVEDDQLTFIGFWGLEG